VQGYIQLQQSLGQSRINRNQKIRLTVKICILAFLGIFSSHYFQIGEHVVPLHLKDSSNLVKTKNVKRNQQCLTRSCIALILT